MTVSGDAVCMKYNMLPKSRYKLVIIPPHMEYKSNC